MNIGTTRANETDTNIYILSYIVKFLLTIKNKRLLVFKKPFNYYLTVDVFNQDWFRTER
jgi:hypothetical protein